jgi:plasmid stabilization system protein ParE
VIYSVQLAIEAQADIQKVLDWFAQQEAIDAGNQWVSQLYEKAETLQQNPQRCFIVPKLSTEYREIRQLLFGNRLIKYRLLFEIKNQTVNILRVWHSSRDEILPKDL